MMHCFGLAVFSQAASAASYGLAPRGWILYPVLLLTVLQYITEPCIQGLMATLVDADRQGSLQVSYCQVYQTIYSSNFRMVCLPVFFCVALRSSLRATTKGVGVES